MEMTSGTILNSFNLHKQCHSHFIDENTKLRNIGVIHILTLKLIVKITDESNKQKQKKTTRLKIGRSFQSRWQSR